MQIRIRIHNSLRKAVLERLKQAYALGSLRLVKRIHALLYLADGKTVVEVAEILHLGEQTVRDYFHAFLRTGLTAWFITVRRGVHAGYSKAKERSWLN